MMFPIDITDYGTYRAEQCGSGIDECNKVRQEQRNEFIRGWMMIGLIDSCFRNY